MRRVCATQDCQEWFDARVGKVTASRIADAMQFVKKGSKKRGDVRIESGADRLCYIKELAWGMITRVPADHFVSRDMELGKQFEPIARAEYQFRFGAEVDRTGFVLHPTIDFLGASPDGLIGTDGGIEIKVPKFKTHTTYIETDAIPMDYQLQMYCNMLCCEREWWDFVSFCPKREDMGLEALALPDQYRLFRKRLFADQDKFREIEEAAARTIEEAIAKVGVIQERFPIGKPQRSKVHVELKQSLDDYDHSKDFAEQEYDFLYAGNAALSDTP